MAEKSDETTTKADKEPAEEKVDRARLVREAYQFFGVSPHVVAGALHDLGGGDGDLQPSKVESAIGKFLKRDVKE